MGSALQGVGLDFGPAVGGFGGDAPEYELGDAALEQRGWVPKKGVVGLEMKPAGLGAMRATTACAGTASSEARAAATQKGQVGGKRGSTAHRRGSTQGTMRTALADQRKSRVRTKGYMTESERAYQQPRQQRPSADELARPMRSVAGKRVTPKRVDLAVAGETDGIIPQDEPREGPTHEIHEIFPEKFVGAAGTASSSLFKQMARSEIVEYFPEKLVQDYVHGEVDELIYGESLDPQPKIAEIPMLNPNKFMSSAGLTSKEQAHHVIRNRLQERLESEHAPPAPFVDTHADEIIYGRSTSDPTGHAVPDIAHLPVHGSATFADNAGLNSKDAIVRGMERLDLRLDKRIRTSQAQEPYLGGQSEQAIYGRQMGNGPAEKSCPSVFDLRPETFENAAGLKSYDVIRSNPDWEHYEMHAPTKKENPAMRRGGELASQLEGGARNSLDIVSNAGTHMFEGAAGMSSGGVAQAGSVHEMVWRNNPSSSQNAGGEAEQAIYGRIIGKEGGAARGTDGKYTFDIQSIYPNSFDGAAGSSSGKIFKNAPEATSRHLFSENLKDRIVGQRGAGTDASPFPMPGEAGLTSKELFKGHALDGIGDRADPAVRPTGAHTRDEEADLVIYGADLPDEAFDNPIGISDKKPKAFDGAAGLTSKKIFSVTQEHLLTPEHHPEEHMLGMARWGGEAEETIYGHGNEGAADNQSVEYEVQNLAPEAYDGCAGLTSKEISSRNVQILHEKAGGKKQGLTPGAEPGVKSIYATTDFTAAAGGAFDGAAGLTSKQIFHLDAHLEASNRTRPVKVDLREGGEAAATVFGKTDASQDLRGTASFEHAGAEAFADVFYLGAAGLSSKKVTKQAAEAKVFDIGSLSDPGGTEGHDVMYGREGPDGDPRVYEIPELFPDKYIGSAGMPSKDISRQKAGALMFGEKREGVEHGAGHRRTVDFSSLPSAANMNASFMRQTQSWATPQYPEEHPAPLPPPEAAPNGPYAEPAGAATFGKRTPRGPSSPASRGSFGSPGRVGGPTLFEKGSHAHAKVSAARREDGGPISTGRSSGRSGGSRDRYADFASRLNEADSHRSRR